MFPINLETLNLWVKLKSDNSRDEFLKYSTVQYTIVPYPLLKLLKPTVR